MEINLYMDTITKQSSWRKQQYSTWGHTGTVAKMKLKLTKVYTDTCDIGRKSGQDQTKTNQSLHSHLWHWKPKMKPKLTKVYTDTCDTGRVAKIKLKWPKFTLTLVTLEGRVAKMKPKLTKVYTDTCDTERKSGQDETETDKSLHWHLGHWKEEWPRWNQNWPRFTLTFVTLEGRVAKMKQKLTKVYTDPCDTGRKSGHDKT